MELIEIKKSLYKEKPTAIFLMIKKGVVYYYTSLSNEVLVYFEIPVTDMGDAEFKYEMDAKLLIRWITSF